MTRALRELQIDLQDEKALFNQVILAAPDVDAEIFRRDLAPALVQMERQGMRLAVPVIRAAPGRSDMCFRQWSPASDMKPNRYGIPEPVGTLDVRLREIDLALIPLVAWDAQGGRLGMGASFYDRFFQTVADQRQPYRLGVAYRLQQVERLPLDPWDIRLHGILTEDGCFSCPF